MKLQIIEKEEYVLSLREFKHEKKSKETKDKDNNKAFMSDLEAGVLNRYSGGHVAYKDGILCGHSKDAELLRREVNFHLCCPNVNFYKVIK